MFDVRQAIPNVITFKVPGVYVAWRGWCGVAWVFAFDLFTGTTRQ